MYLYYTTSNNKYVRQIRQAIRKEQWGGSLINLAWTAGPVTYLALYGGYYIGYGKPPNPELFIYFMIYTIITGIMAIAHQFIKVLLVIPKREANERQWLQSVDHLFLLYFSARNSYLQTYPSEERKIVAGWWSCRSASTDLDVLEETIRDISGSDQLAHAMKRIEFYRRQGFIDLMNSEGKLYQQEIMKLYDQLSPQFPSLARYIQERFIGNPPCVDMGQPRTEGFIERLSMAGEQHNPDLATYDDALAMILLALEFMLGREIIALYPRFNRHRDIEHAREKFDRLLSDFRLQLRKRNSIMRLLIQQAVEEEHIETTQTRNTSSEQLREMLVHILALIPSTTRYKRLYQSIRKANQRLIVLWKELSAHEKYYNNLWSKQHHKIRRDFSTENLSQHKNSILTIEEHLIGLSSKERDSFCETVTEILSEITVGKRHLIAMESKANLSQPMEMDDYKMIAVKLLNALDDVLNITEPEEQLAIEGSREPDFGCIEPGHAARIKVSLGSAMVSEVQHDRIYMSHRLAALLVRYLNIPLGKGIVDYLVNRYGASREYLETLTGNEDGEHVQLASNRLQPEIIHLPKW